MAVVMNGDALAGPIEIGLQVIERTDSDVGRRDHGCALAQAQLTVIQFAHRVGVALAVVVGAIRIAWRQLPICLAEVAGAIIGVHICDELSG